MSDDWAREEYKSTKAERASETACAAEEKSAWQGTRAGADAVLRCVLECVGARALCASACVCRAWRNAAAESALWRRCVLPRARPLSLNALNATAELHRERTGAESDSWCEWDWREEYALTAARWRRGERLASAGAGAAAVEGAGADATLQCMALDSTGKRLVLLREDAHVTIYERNETTTCGEPEWRTRWDGVASAEWASAAHAQWAPRAPRLLLAGTLALAQRTEVIIMDVDGAGRARVASRAGGAGAALGCWAHDAAFLTPQLRLLAPGRAVTTLWLNSATQETQSEHAGVTAPVLRIYNEASTHITHMLIADVPSGSEEAGAGAHADADVGGERGPGAAYFHALRPNSPTEAAGAWRVLVVAGGSASSEREQARALLLWALPALALPALHVQDRLAERCAEMARRRARAPDREPEPALDEAAVRALCTPPAAVCTLSARILGLVLHPRGRCVWASTCAGAACVSLPALRPLLLLAHAPAPPTSLAPHLVQPTVDEDYFISPTGGDRRALAAWAARSGARALSPALPPAHGAPALGALLLPRSCSAPTTRLLVLTSDALDVWYSDKPPT